MPPLITTPVVFDTGLFSEMSFNKVSTIDEAESLEKGHVSIVHYF